MVEIQSWAGQACFGISLWGARVNIINRISCQNLSHFDVAFVLKWVSHLGSAYVCVCVCVYKHVYINNTDLVGND